MENYSIYLHIPFCTHRCGYCDFNTYAGKNDLVPAYVEALQAEIKYIKHHAPGPLQAGTIFFGGGTPSTLPPAQIEATLAAIKEHILLEENAEISLEANPGTLSQDYLDALRLAGINRLSLGMQSASPEELRLLERGHDHTHVIKAICAARKAGFDNINLDLIFGLPEQRLATWQHSLELALELRPQHLALYALTIEDGTPFGQWARRGLLSLPDPDLAAEMYDWASQRLEDAGFVHYEISNWARHNVPGPIGTLENPSLACQHNLQYWRNLPYLGLGAGAHGYEANIRTANIISPEAFIRRLNAPPERAPLVFPNTPATLEARSIGREGEISETMMMGLRLLREGVSREVFAGRFGENLATVFEAQIGRLTGLGLLEWAGPGQETLRLSASGRLLGNQVFVEFI